MNKSFLIVLILCLAVCLGLAACSHTSKQTPQPEPEVEATAEPETEPSGAPELNGKLEENMVLVVFESEETDDFTGLTVWNEDGDLLKPLMNKETGEPVWGTYYLQPGEYQFSFHDEQGNSKDFDKIAFTIWENIDKALVSLSEEPRVIGMLNSLSSFINPVYRDITDEEDMPTLSDEDRQEALERFKQILDAMDAGLYTTDADS